MATIKDVAQLAGVSIATVSNYLNRTKPVSRETEQKIRKAVEVLHYSQNFSAKTLKSNVYTDVGVILPNFNDPYYVQIFQGIESVFQNSPYFLNLAFTYDLPELEQNVLHNMLRKQVCGLILVTCQPEAWKFYYENFNRYDRPIILLDRAIRNLDASLITFDNRASIQKMTAQLLKTGRRGLELVAGPSAFTCEQNCVDGYLAAWREAGLTPPEDSVHTIPLDKESAFYATIELLKHRRPEVILATSELTSIGIIESLRVLGYTERDIQVLTLGEEHWNSFTHSFATYSTARPAMKMGSRAAGLLIEKLRSPLLQESEQIILSNGKRDEASSDRLRNFHMNFAERAAQCEPLRVLMPDTPFVHTFCGLVRNFEVVSGVRVEFHILPHHQIYNEILRSAQSELPEDRYDVVMYDLPWLPQLAAGGILKNLTSFVRAMDMSVFLPRALEYFSEFRGEFYGLPFTCAPQVLYYRKDLFSSQPLQMLFEKTYGVRLRPPVTFKEFNVIAKFFAKNVSSVDYSFSISAAYDECFAPELYMRLRAYGSQVLDSHGRAVFDTPQTLKAYINLSQAIHLSAPDFQTATDVSIVDDFMKGKTAMLLSYPSFLANIHGLKEGNMTGAIGCAHVPGRKPLLGGWSLGIGKRCKNDSVAFRFVEWACANQMSNYFSILGGQPAVNSSYTNDELVKLYPWLPMYYDAYCCAQPMLPTFFENGTVISPNSIDEIVCRWAYRMIRQECSVEDAIARTQTDLEQFIAANASRLPAQ